MNIGFTNDGMIWFSQEAQREDGQLMQVSTKMTIEGTTLFIQNLERAIEECKKTIGNPELLKQLEAKNDSHGIDSTGIQRH